MPMPRITNTIAMPMYGAITREASSSNRASRAAPVSRPNSFSMTLASPSRKKPTTNGARIAAPLLQMPMMLMRAAALSSGPTTVMYGLLAVCNMDKPAPMVKSPARKIG